MRMIEMPLARYSFVFSEVMLIFRVTLLTANASSKLNIQRINNTVVSIKCFRRSWFCHFVFLRHCWCHSSYAPAPIRLCSFIHSRSISSQKHHIQCICSVINPFIIHDILKHCCVVRAYMRRQRTSEYLMCIQLDLSCLLHFVTQKSLVLYLSVSQFVEKFALQFHYTYLLSSTVFLLSY